MILFKYSNIVMLEDNLFTKWFGQLTDEQVDMVKNNSVVLNYNKAEMICKQGAFASNVYFVENGMMKAYKEYKENNLIMRFVTGVQTCVLTVWNGARYL